MALVRFESLDDCDIVEVEFLGPDGDRLAARLFVDSGFTGASAFVLSEELVGFALANLMSAEAAGALSGMQRRILVRCSIPQISFERNLVAIAADVGMLSLPVGVDGMAGLTFLRQFTGWGAERTADEKWWFFLAYEGEA